MSSAILYLAIVAIWAGVLMPRWLRTPHGSRTVAENHFESVDPREAVAWAEDDEDDFGEDFDADAADADAGRADRRGPPARTEPGGERALPPAAEPQERAAAWPSAAERRARVLQARRRTLTTLTVLTAGAVGIAVTHLAASWVIIPPVLMLAGFMLLLREAARIDAERARAARTHARDGVGRTAVAGDAGVRAARPGPGDRAPEPTAEIIDISGRLGDQLYDQYTDAAVRAIGD